MAGLPTVRITDYALRSLVDALSSRRPEQGGALLGLRGADVVTAFIHDVDAPVTAVEYHNTDALIGQIQRVEAETEARFKGIVHSHPRGMPRPSSQDVYEYGRSLALNPGMSQYLAMIVTFDLDTPLEQHELIDGLARLSCFGARAGREGASLVKMRPRPVPIDESVRRAGLRFTEGEPALVDIDGVPMICGQIEGAGYFDASMLFSVDFPAVPPVLINFAGAAEEEPLSWDLRVRPAERLARALEVARENRRFRASAELLASQLRAAQVSADQLATAGPAAGQPGAARAAGGADRDAAAQVAPAPAGPGTADPADPAGPAATTELAPPTCDPAAHARPDPVAAAPPVVPGAEVLFARTGGILSTQLRNRHAILVGAGSVGSYVAEMLVRSGVGALTLVDPEPVEPENLGRSGYVTRDIGRAKVAALAERLTAINPEVRLTCHATTVDALGPQVLVDAVRGADLVVAATDDNRAQQRLNHVAYWSGIPAVFIGLFGRAAGGEVIVTYPDGPCWQCSTGNARIDRSPETRRVTDYSTGRLVAEPGLLTDIHFVSAAGAKLGLALLHRAGDGGGLAAFLDEPRQRRQATVVFAMVPRYDFFPRVLQRAGGQYAFQSIWMSAEPQPSCPVCGDPQLRSDPMSGATPPTTGQLLRHVVRQQATALEPPGAGETTAQAGAAGSGGAADPVTEAGTDPGAERLERTGDPLAEAGTDLGGDPTETGGEPRYAAPAGVD